MLTVGYQEPMRLAGVLLGAFSFFQLALYSGLLTGGFRSKQFSLFRLTVSQQSNPVMFWAVILLLCLLLAFFVIALWFATHIFRGYELA